jgi:hypothetical protein
MCRQRTALAFSEFGFLEFRYAAVTAGVERENFRKAGLLSYPLRNVLHGAEGKALG